MQICNWASQGHNSIIETKEILRQHAENRTESYKVKNLYKQL